MHRSSRSLLFNTLRTMARLYSPASPAAIALTPLIHDHPHRRVTFRGRAVAELAEAVVAPGPHRAVLLSTRLWASPAAMATAPFRPLTLQRRMTLRGRAVAELGRSLLAGLAAPHATAKITLAAIDERCPLTPATGDRI